MIRIAYLTTRQHVPRSFMKRHVCRVRVESRASSWSPQSSLSDDTDWRSSSTSMSSQEEIYPKKPVSLLKLNQNHVFYDGHIPSCGALHHPECFRCVPFARGRCERGVACHRCHDPHTNEPLPQSRRRAQR